MCVKNLGMNFVKCIPHKTTLLTLCVMFSDCRFYHSLTIRLFNRLAICLSIHLFIDLSLALLSSPACFPNILLRLSLCLSSSSSFSLFFLVSCFTPSLPIPPFVFTNVFFPIMSPQAHKALQFVCLHDVAGLGALWGHAYVLTRNLQPFFIWPNRRLRLEARSLTANNRRFLCIQIFFILRTEVACFVYLFICYLNTVKWV